MIDTLSSNSDSDSDSSSSSSSESEQHKYANESTIESIPWLDAFAKSRDMLREFRGVNLNSVVTQNLFISLGLNRFNWRASEEKLRPEDAPVQIRSRLRRSQLETIRLDQQALM